MFATILALAIQAGSPIDRQAAFEHLLFVEAGFAPVAERTADGRQVRRLLLRDPYGILPIPGVAIERLADGRVTIAFQYRRWSTEPVEVASAAWERLEGLEGAAFAPPAAVAGRPGASPPPPTVCHGWIARIEGGADRSGSWAGCGGRDDARLAYVKAFVSVALATRPDCEQDGKDPFWAFQTCFKQRDTMDDAALGTHYAALKAEWEGLPGADRLAAARMALRDVPAPGSPQWLAARDAVAQVRDIQDKRRDILRRMRSLAYASPAASPADRARLGETIDAWAAWLPSQDQNYIGLTDALIWPAPSATRR